jgi:hypothetical protein
LLLCGWSGIVFQSEGFGFDDGHLGIIFASCLLSELIYGRPYDLFDAYGFPFESADHDDIKLLEIQHLFDEKFYTAGNILYLYKESLFLGSLDVFDVSYDDKIPEIIFFFELRDEVIFFEIDIESI